MNILQQTAEQMHIFNLQIQDLRCVEFYGIQYKKLCTDFRKLDSRLTSVYNRIKFLDQLIENGYEIGRKKHNNIILRLLGFEENYYIPLTDEKMNWHKEQKEHLLNQFNDLLPERNTLKDKIESLLIENEYIIYDKRF